MDLRNPQQQRKLLAYIACVCVMGMQQVRQAAALLATFAPAKEDRPWLMLSTQAWMATGQAALAAERLQAWVVLHPRDALAWTLLSGAYAAQGQALRSVRADAEAKVAVLDYEAALDRFNAAQAMVLDGVRAAGVDHVEASIVDTRRREVQSLLKEQALER